MRLAKLSKFRDMIYAEGSAPSLNTLRAQIRADKLPGGLIQGDHFFVDMDEFDRVTGLRDKIAARQAQVAKDPLLAGLI